MPLEEATKKLTFVPASLFGLEDRGLIRSGSIADLVIFNQETIVRFAPKEIQDFPYDGKRLQELAQGIDCTVVNGHILIEKKNQPGVFPGKVTRNGYYRSKSHD